MPVPSIRRFARDCRGAVLVEFGFVVPILVVILLGCYEASRYVLIHQKLDRVATSMADLVAQANGITAAQIDDLFGAAEQLAWPYDLAGKGRILVSSVYGPSSGAPEVAWRHWSQGTLAVSSQIGATGEPATMPDVFTVRPGENVIVAEVWFAYEPLFGDILFHPVQLYHTAFNRPRVINLTTCTGCSN